MSDQPERNPTPPPLIGESKPARPRRVTPAKAPRRKLTLRDGEALILDGPDGQPIAEIVVRRKRRHSVQFRIEVRHLTAPMLEADAPSPE